MYLHCSIKRDTNSIMLVRKHVQLKGKVAAKMVFSFETCSIGNPTSNDFLLELILTENMNSHTENQLVVASIQQSNFICLVQTECIMPYMGSYRNLSFRGKKAKPAAIWAL